MDDLITPEGWLTRITSWWGSKNLEDREAWLLKYRFNKKHAKLEWIKLPPYLKDRIIEYLTEVRNV